MTIAHAFQYEKPGTVGQAVKLLSHAGASARVLAGGTDLVGWLRDDLIAPDLLVDIKGIDSLKKLKFQKGCLNIGALVTMSEILESKTVRSRFPLIFEMAGMLACKGIRNRATVVGNICSAVPCCDNGPVLLVYDAMVHVDGPDGRRDIPMSAWFLGPRKTALKSGELVTGLSVPFPEGKHAGCYTKQKRYRGEDLAQSSIAVLLTSDGIHRVAFGAVGPTPVRAPLIESMLSGKSLTDELIGKACDGIPAETAPITDIRSTKEYRAHMLRVMLERALRATESRLRGRGPEYGVNVIE